MKTLQAARRGYVLKREMKMMRTKIMSCFMRKMKAKAPRMTRRLL